MELINGSDGKAECKAEPRPCEAPAGLRPAPGAKPEKAQNAILGQMGGLADQEMHEVEGGGLHPAEKYLEHAAGMLSGEGVIGSHQHDCRPEEGREKVDEKASGGRIQVKGTRQIFMIYNL